MFLPASSTLPLLPPPFTSILSTHYSSSSSNSNSSSSDQNPYQSSQRRSNSTRNLHASSHRNPSTSLHNLLVDESAIASRKAAVATYGYSWLRPAGVAKTMLGRREEEAEREELERQMREQEEMELEMERAEELARQATLREEGGAEETTQRNLDDAIPDADAIAQRAQHENDEGEGEGDLDDDIPDADAEGDNTFPDEEDTNIEGETGITDDVEHTNLGSGGHLNRPAISTTTPSSAIAPPGNRGAPNLNLPQARIQAQTARQAYLQRREQEHEQQALANAMLDEDEQGFADRDLDADIPDGDDDEAVLIEARDLDDDIPEADRNGDDESGEWQHTDTELDEDESAVLFLEDDGNAGDGDVSMDMSGIAIQAGTRSSTSGGATHLNILQTPASTADTESASAGRSWLNRRSIFGTGRGRTGNLFAGITGGASANGSPQPPPPSQLPAVQAPPPPEHGTQQQPQPPARRRRSPRHVSGRENRSARDSLD